MLLQKLLEYKLVFLPDVVLLCVYFFFQRVLKVYIKSSVDVQSKRTLKSCSKCVKFAPNLMHLEQHVRSALIWPQIERTLRKKYTVRNIFKVCCHKQV